MFAEDKSLAAIIPRETAERILVCVCTETEGCGKK